MSTSIGFWLTDVQPKSRRTTPSEAYRRTTIVASRRTKRARENTSVGALVSRALGGRDTEGVSGRFPETTRCHCDRVDSCIPLYRCPLRLRLPHQATSPRFD